MKLKMQVKSRTKYVTSPWAIVAPAAGWCCCTCSHCCTCTCTCCCVSGDVSAALQDAQEL